MNHSDVTPAPNSLDQIDKSAVKAFLLRLQDSICQQVESIESKSFELDAWQRDKNDPKKPLGGGGESRVLKEGSVFEQAGVNFSHVFGDKMPASATAHRPELAGRRFEAMGVSIVIHPHNPYVPTTHANVRFFIAEKEGHAPIWWFGGGFDLTPFYPFEEDCRFWHQSAKDICGKFGDNLYAEHKAWCDKYFFLPHRDETRGIGGLFFDDFNQLGFEKSFAYTKAVGEGFMQAYLPIVKKRYQTEFTQKQRDFQLYRRGRYVEFNLVYDRGTLFGLQSGGRTESILMSMPPLVRWEYQYQVEPNSAEADLYQNYLKPRDWV